MVNKSNFFENVGDSESKSLEYLLKKADSKKEVLDELRPLPKETVKSLRGNLAAEWTYNSNAIEGNTLTLHETIVVLQGMTIGGKKLSEHLEIIGHKEAIEYLEELTTSNNTLTETVIQQLHYLILNKIDRQNAGVYRKVPVTIVGAKHIPPQPFMITPAMEILLDWYHNSKEHPILKASKLHSKFVNIHPFIDGNGRTSRLLLNFELLKSGYPPIVIKVEDRVEYFKCLDIAATENNLEPFFKFISRAVILGLDFYLNVIGKEVNSNDKQK